MFQWIIHVANSVTTTLFRMLVVVQLSQFCLTVEISIAERKRYELTLEYRKIQKNNSAESRL